MVTEVRLFLIIIEVLLGIAFDDWLVLCLEVLKSGLAVREWNLVFDFLALIACEYIQSHPLMASDLPLNLKRTHLPLIPMTNRAALIFILCKRIKKRLAYWLPCIGS